MQLRPGAQLRRKNRSARQRASRDGAASQGDFCDEEGVAPGPGGVPFSTLVVAPRHSAASNPVMSRPKNGQTLEVRFERLAYGGEAVGRADGFVVFAKYAAPGELARIKITKSKKSYAQGKVLEILEPAPERIDPVCPLFGTCGGCSWQHLPIEEQMRWKEEIVRDALRPLPDAGSVPILPVVPSPNAHRYRNKMEFTFARDAETQRLAAGFHMPGNWKHILDVEKCWLAPEPAERVLRAAVAEGERQCLTAWDPTRHHGALRHLVLRWSVEEQKLLAAILTGDQSLDFSAFADALFNAEPALAGLMWGLNSGKSDVARAESVLAQRGEESFDERLGPFLFRVSLGSFFQTNTRGAEKLYDTAKEALELTGSETLLDAYCGTGTIGIYCGRETAELYGIEIVQDAIWDARANAWRNGLENATFVAGDMRTTLPRVLDVIPGRIDRLVVDPPRGGMDKKSLQQLVKLGAPIIAYVSCNPTTMARDLETALENGYIIEWVRPVDMFPQTYHVECVAKLKKINKESEP